MVYKPVTAVLVTPKGYPLEEHFVRTSDGCVLCELGHHSKWTTGIQ